MMKKDDYRKSRDAILLTSNIPLLKFNLRQYNTQNTFHSQSQIAQSHWAKKALTVLFFFFDNTLTNRHTQWEDCCLKPIHQASSNDTWSCDSFHVTPLHCISLCVSPCEAHLHRCNREARKKNLTHTCQINTHTDSLVKVTHK